MCAKLVRDNWLKDSFPSSKWVLAYFLNLSFLPQVILQKYFLPQHFLCFSSFFSSFPLDFWISFPSDQILHRWPTPSLVSVCVVEGDGVLENEIEQDQKARSSEKGEGEQDREKTGERRARPWEKGSGKSALWGKRSKRTREQIEPK